MRKPCIVCKRQKDHVLAEFCEWACDKCQKGKGPKKGTHAPQIHSTCLHRDLDWKTKGKAFAGKWNEPVAWHCPACRAQELELPADSESPAEPAPAAPAAPAAPEPPQPEGEADASVDNELAPDDAESVPPVPPAPRAPPADSKNALLVTPSCPAPKRARASPLKDCLEALRDKFEEEFDETFKVEVALAWCDANGAKKISLIVKAKCVDAFVDHLGLEFVPAMGLKNMLREEYA